MFEKSIFGMIFHGWKLGTFHFLSPKGAGGNHGGVISNIIPKKGGSSVILSRKTKEGAIHKNMKINLISMDHKNSFNSEQNTNLEHNMLT